MSSLPPLFTYSYRPLRLFVTLRSIALLMFFISFLASPLYFINHDTSDSGIILLTGFEPFGKNPVNSSWEAVRQLNGVSIGSKRIVAVRLPVVWGQAGVQLRAAIDRYNPDLVINVGQGGDHIELISSAHNIVWSITDNVGAKPVSPMITADGPAVFDTSLDYGAMIKTLAQAHIAASASDSAGAYLCNFVSYSSYEYLAQVDPDTATLFVHVPPIASLESPQDKRILNQLVAALKIIIESANKQIMFVTYSSSQVD